MRTLIALLIPESSGGFRLTFIHVQHQPETSCSNVRPAPNSCILLQHAPISSIIRQPPPTSSNLFQPACDNQRRPASACVQEPTKTWDHLRVTTCVRHTIYTIYVELMSTCKRWRVLPPPTMYCILRATATTNPNPRVCYLQLRQHR